MIGEQQKPHGDTDKSFVPIVDSIYIDLEALIDIDLGMLLTTISSELQYKYMRSRLSDYDGRYDNDILKYFPSLKLDKEEFNKRYEDPELLARAITGAPYTSILETLSEILPAHAATNQTITGSPTITIFISSSKGYPIPESVKQRVKMCLLPLLPGNLKITFFDEPFTHQKDKVISTIDLCIFNDIKDFLQLGSRGHELFISEQKFANKLVMSRPYIDRSLKHEGNVTDAILLRNTKSALSIWCDFAYTINTILTQ